MIQVIKKIAIGKLKRNTYDSSCDVIDEKTGSTDALNNFFYDLDGKKVKITVEVTEDGDN